jgi:hypothetical protein
LPFKCNLQRYNALRPPGAKPVQWFFDVLLELEWWGLYKLNAVDP